MSSSVISAHKSYIEATAFEPFELDPDDVLEGPFDGRVHWLRQQSGGEGVLLAGIFICAASKVNHSFSADETFHVLSGAATYELSDGTTTSVTVGDIASFSKGASGVFTAHSEFKKFFVISG